MTYENKCIFYIYTQRYEKLTVRIWFLFFVSLCLALFLWV